MYCLPEIAKRVGSLMVLAGVLSLTISTDATAQVTARVTDWKIPLAIVGMGVRIDRTPLGNPAGSASTVWMTTKTANPHLIKFVPGIPLESAPSAWTAWPIDPAVEAAGVDVSADGQVFMNSNTGIQRINPATNARTQWAIAENGTSDLSIGPDGGVWTALPFGPIQRLVISGPSATTATVTRWITRWARGGGSGEIALGGIRANPQSGLIYFTSNGHGLISELNPATNQVRSWSTLSVGAIGPRQLSIDSSGDIWTVTVSNHILRLRPGTNELFAYLIPTPNAHSYGIVADGLVGFTETIGFKVGVLAPTGVAVVVLPEVSFVTPSTETLEGIMDTKLPTTGTTNPTTTDIPAEVTSTDQSGVFTEASPPQSRHQIGIDSYVNGSATSFYYAGTYSQLGHVTFGIGAVGFITGGGAIDVAGGKASFGFSVLRRVPGEPVRGNLHYKNHVTGEIIDSETITDIYVAGTTASFSGTMIKNGASTVFRVDVTDNGEPGANDRFSLSHSGTSVSNSLKSGNIQIHRDKSTQQ